MTDPSHWVTVAMALVGRVGWEVTDQIIDDY